MATLVVRKERLVPRGKDRNRVGVAPGLAEVWGAGRAAGAGRDLAWRQTWGSAQWWHPGQRSSSHAPPCPAVPRLGWLVNFIV